MLNRLFVQPRWSRDWAPLLLMTLVVYVAALDMRLLDFGSWNREQMVVDREFIMGTHDAYHWLAGAVGVGGAAGSPMSETAAWTAELLGVSPGIVGFWSPVAAASLVAVAVLLWAWVLGGMEAGIMAGILASLAPGFFFRTRFGYFDTDMVTLLFPLLISFGPACWLSSRIEGSWSGVLSVAGSLKRWFRGESPDEAGSEEPGMAWMLAMGLAANLMSAWHWQIGVYVRGVFLICFLLGVLLARPGRRTAVFWGLTLFGLAAFGGWIGFGIGLAVLVLFKLLPDYFKLIWASPWPVLICLALVFVYVGLTSSTVADVLKFIANYLKPTAQEGLNGSGVSKAAGLVYPGIGQSVIEAQNVKISEILYRLHLWRAAAAIGLVGFVLVLAFRPLALPLLPLVVLALASQKLGSRMTMFGAPAMALGLALPAFWAVQAAWGDKPWRRLAHIGIQVGLGLILLVPYYNLYKRLMPTPVMVKPHCLALKELKKISPPDAMVWTWWDWGYAVNYYAQRASFADGGYHSGEYVFTLGRVLTTDNPRLANQLIKYSALNGYRPWNKWKGFTPNLMTGFLRDLSLNDKGLTAPKKQYLVLTQENIRLAPWINYYGVWNFHSKKGVHSRIVKPNEAVDVDYNKGIIVLKQSGARVRVSTIDLLAKDGRKFFDYPGNKPTDRAAHLLLSPGSRKIFILDDLAYNSMMVRMMLIPPDSEEIKPYFRLVYEYYPWIRIFEVL